MSSAAERAKARREALLNRGTDRLAKLTTSARGDDATYLSHDRPLAPSLSNFLGEDAGPSVPAPATPHRHPTPRAESASPSPDPARTRSTPSSRKPSSQQQQFEELAAGFGLPPGMQLPPMFEQFLAGAAGTGSGGFGEDNPFAALMGPGGTAPPTNLMRMPGMPGMPGMPMPGMQQQMQEPPAPRTLIQRLVPLLHLLAVFTLVTFMAFSQMPYSASWEQRSRAWGALAKRKDERDMSLMPRTFFWTFLSMELFLHSLRIVSRKNTVELPTIVSLAMPYLPAPIPSLIVNGTRYYNMMGVLLDDLAAFVFTLGVIVWFQSV